MGNIQGLYPKSNQSKVPFLRELAAEEDPMFIALTETHLREVREAQINIYNYTTFEVDRETQSHGGVILYIRNDLAATTKTVLAVSNGEVELIIVHILPMNIMIINCYRPPQCSKENFIAAINDMKALVKDLPRPVPDIIMCGDFNFPHMKWPAGTVHGGTREEQAQARALIELSDGGFLTQYITQPTRHNKILDLFFTNNEESIQ